MWQFHLATNFSGVVVLLGSVSSQPRSLNDQMPLPLSVVTGRRSWNLWQISKFGIRWPNSKSPGYEFFVIIVKAISCLFCSWDR